MTNEEIVSFFRSPDITLEQMIKHWERAKTEARNYMNEAIKGYILNEEEVYRYHNYVNNYEKLVKWLSELKTLHGEWVDNTYKYVKELDAFFIQARCTICGRFSDRIDIYSRYMSNKRCSHCGAIMDRGQTRNLTDEETEIYNSWIDSEAEDTGVNILGGEQNGLQ